MTLTESARKQLDTVLGPSEALEIGLKTGGCSGATITMDRVLLKNTSESSTRKIGKDYIVWADPTSQTFLIEGKLDYVTDIMGSSFVVTPPEGTQSCGCGSSIVIG